MSKQTRTRVIALVIAIIMGVSVFAPVLIYLLNA